MRSRDTWFVNLFVILVVGAVIGLLVTGVRRDNRIVAECKAKGGEIIRAYKSRPVCVKPGTLLP